MEILNIIRRNKIVLALFIVAFVVGMGLWISRDNESDTPTLKLPDPLDGVGVLPPVEIKLEIDREELNLPSVLPTYRLQNTPWNESDFLRIANSLGFDSQPEIVRDVSLGSVAVWWNQTDGYLRIVPGAQIIDYKPVFPSLFEASVFPPEEKLIEIAKEYLFSRELIFEEGLDVNEVTYMVANEQEDFVPVDRSIATLATIKFLRKIGEFEIISETSLVGNLSTTLTRSGELFSLYIDDTPEIVSDEKFPIKSYDEIRSSLSKAKIQSFNNGEIESYEIPLVEIKNIIVKEINLAYLSKVSANQLFLQPIFILKGSTILNSGKEIQTTLQLPAVDEEFVR